MFLCRYLGSEAFRREIHERLNVVENWNSANGFIFFGRGGEVATNRQEDQEISVLALHPLQNCLVHVNTLMAQRVLADPKWAAMTTKDDDRKLRLLIYAHVNPYGRFDLDVEQRLDFDQGCPWRAPIGRYRCPFRSATITFVCIRSSGESLDAGLFSRFLRLVQMIINHIVRHDH